MVSKTYNVSDFDAIIYDLGAVIIDISYETTIKAFEALGIESFSTIFSKAQQSALTDNFETGHISETEFFTELNEKLGGKYEIKALIDAWNAMLGEIPQNHVDLLLASKQMVPTFMLSNTNETHIKFIYNYLEEKFGVNNFKPWFSKVYMSFEMGKRKPNADIFEQVLQENNLDAAKVLYIDDSLQHIESARKLGIISHHLLDHEDVSDLIVLK